ncbi:MAG: hypothetical protein ABDK94_03530 [Atribacterota bacterium]
MKRQRFAFAGFWGFSMVPCQKLTLLLPGVTIEALEVFARRVKDGEEAKVDF